MIKTNISKIISFYRKAYHQFRAGSTAMGAFGKVLNVDENLFSVVRKSYGKTEENIAQDLAILKEWYSKQAHFPREYDDQWLERVLMRNKFRIEQTKKKLEAYYTLRGLNREWFELEKFLPTTKKFGDLLKCCFLYPCPIPTSNGERIHIFKLKSKDVELFDFKHMMKFVYICSEILTQLDYTICDRFICDMSNYQMAHFLKIDPMDLTKTIMLWQEGFSARLAGIEYINAPSFVNIIIKVVKPLLKHGKISVHENMESLYEVVPKKYLPEDLGGTCGTLLEIQDNWLSEIEKNWDWISFRSKQVSNESLRIGKSHYDDQFGIEGTFKKINID